MKKIRTAICDDDRAVRKQISEIIEKYEKGKYSFQIDCFSNPDLPFSSFNYDILFLDIMFGETSAGLDVIRKLRENGNNLYVILISSYSSYSISKTGFTYDAEDYILKPVNQEEVHRVLDKILRDMEKKEDHFGRILIKNKGSAHLVAVKEIMYIDIVSRQRWIHTQTQTFSTQQSLSDIFQSLPGEIFTYTYSSYVVNLNFVDFLEGDRIMLTDGTKIPLSRTYRKEFLEKLNRVALGGNGDA